MTPLEAGGEISGHRLPSSRPGFRHHHRSAGGEGSALESLLLIVCLPALPSERSWKERGRLVLCFAQVGPSSVLSGCSRVSCSDKLDLSTTEAIRSSSPPVLCPRVVGPAPAGQELMLDCPRVSVGHLSSLADSPVAQERREPPHTRGPCAWLWGIL